MNKFPGVITTTAVSVPNGNVDTDVLIRADFLKVVKKGGLGEFLFDAWRFADPGQLGMNTANRKRIESFALNVFESKFGTTPTALIAGPNFGCGSSREHAPYALRDYGFRVIIAPSFADIFYTNVFKNDMVAVILSEGVIQSLHHEASEAMQKGTEPFRLTVSLQDCIVHWTTASGERKELPFEVPSAARVNLLEGRDEVSDTLRLHLPEIEAFEQRAMVESPWEFAPVRLFTS